MTIRLARPLRLLILALAAVCAACALQETAPVKPALAGGIGPGASQERPEGPHYAASQLAIGDEGNLYLVWLAIEQGKNWDALFSRSKDFGATWSEPPISLKPMKATAVGARQIVTGPSGNVYVVWREENLKTKTRRLQFVRSQDRGSHWVEPLQLPIDSDDVGFPQLLADHNGGVYVAALVGPRFRRALDVVSSQDFGATFSTRPVRLTTAFSTSEYGIINHRVTSDGEGHLYVVWEEVRTWQDRRIYLNRSLDRGKTWAAQSILVSTPEEGAQLSYRPEIMATPDGRVYVVFERDEHRQDTAYQPGTIRQPDRFIYINRSLDYGQTWLPQPIRLNDASQGPVASSTPQLSADQHGNVYAIWFEKKEDAENMQLLFRHSTDSGMTWSAPSVRLDLSSSFRGRLGAAAIRSDDAGHVWVLWEELNPSLKKWQLLINRSEDYGKSWRAQATPLTGPAQRGAGFRNVSFVNDLQGHLYVAWDGDPKSSRELYFNRSIDFGATWLVREVHVGRR